ncbi:hypothetical protein N8012_02830 [Pelagibacteraceae bacterium]|jgi:hypothetical protein|nr:hypothetical protein [Pelagibacteraceae bacterium]
MSRLLLIFFMFIFLTGCIQGSAMLGPIIGIGTTGSIQRTLVSQSINHGIKQKTGKNINEHALSSFNKEFKKATE